MVAIGVSLKNTHLYLKTFSVYKKKNVCVLPFVIILYHATNVLNSNL